jgi:hypothetical protein
MFTERLAEQTKRLGLAAIETDIGITEAEQTTRVARAWGLV